MHKYLLSCCVLLASILVLNAQDKNVWTSTWKVFRKNYTYDQKPLMNAKLGSDYVNDVVVDNLGTPWIAAGGKLMQYADGKMTVLRLPFTSKANVTALACDSKNNVWVGSTHGLAVYDGKEWKSMPAGTKEQPIGYIKEIVIDKNDRVWVCGWNAAVINAVGAGLSVYDGNVWTNYNKRDGELPRKFVEDLVLDKDENIWVSMGYNDNGVGKFDGKTWTVYTSKNSPLPSNIVRDIVVDKAGNILMGTPKGIAKFDGENWEITELRDFFKNKFLDFFAKSVEFDILCMALDENDVLWIGTRGKGVYRVIGNSKTILTKDNSPLTSNYVRDIHIDVNGNKWFITGFNGENWKDAFSIEDEVPVAERYQGMVKYEETNYNKYSNWQVYNKYTTAVTDARSFDLTQDAGGNIWAATYSGLLKIDKTAENWDLFKAKGGLFSNTIGSVCLDKDGGIWSGSEAGGLRKLEGEELMAYDKKNSKFEYKAVLDIVAHPDGGIWTSNYKSVVHFDGKDVKEYGKKEGLVTGGAAYSLLVDSKGNLWIGSLRGVSKYDGKTWTTFNKKEHGLLSNQIQCLAEDKDGNIWAGARKGLHKYNGKTWTPFKKVPGSVAALSVTAVATDHNNHIWVGTYNQGLFKYDGSNWEHFNGDNSGMYPKQVNDLMVTPNKELWITTSKSSLARPSTAVMPNPESDEYKINSEITKKITKFEPSGAIIRHQID